MGTARLSAETERNQSPTDSVGSSLYSFQGKKSDLSWAVAEKFGLINSSKHIYLNFVSTTQPLLFY